MIPKKMYKFIQIFLIVIFSISCQNYLDINPKSVITNQDVFSNSSAITAYLASLYNSMPMEDFNYSGQSGFNSANSPSYFLPNMTDESVTAKIDQTSQNLTGTGTLLQWWNYGTIRHVNQFIEQIKKSNFSQDKKNQWLGEALFIRAYDYFGLVKRYGGVPLIKEVLQLSGSNVGKLQVPRNKEEKIYDFISSQLDSAATLMSAKSPSKGRANKYVALALKSRAMLFAASSAAFAPVELNGLVGIPSSDAKQYWQEAYDAANKVIKSKRYSLYNKYPNNKVKNFNRLFIDVDDNPEIIFARYYKYPQKAHSWDYWNLPYETRSTTAGEGSRINPSLQWVEKYEYKDGTQGNLKIKNSQGNRIHYKNPLNIFENKDPRLAATAILPFSSWNNTTIDVRAGIITADGDTITSGTYSKIYKGKHIIGRNGIGGGGGAVSQTGFYIRKYLNPEYSPSEVQSSKSVQPWIEFRFAEVLLNYAEASIELDRKNDAKQAVNKIRERAGIALVNNVTEETIRHEREVELAFEHKHYWDIKRWHIADKLLNNYFVKALLPYYVESDNTYIFKTTRVSYPKTFRTKQYYQQIPPSEITKDPNLKQNPQY